MKLILETEVEDLRISLRQLLGKSDLPRLGVNAADGDRRISLWKSLIEDFGVLTLGVPESLGGDGGGFIERTVVLEEFGRTLAPVPYVSALSAIEVLQHLDALDGYGARSLLGSVLSGEQVPAVCVSTPTGAWPKAAGTTVRADGSGEARSLSGRSGRVPNGSSAGVFIVRAAGEDGIGWYAVEASTAVVTPLESLDTTRPVATIDFDGSTARLIAHDRQDTAFDHLVSVTALAVAADALGGMRTVIEAAVDYAKIRYQFGRPIGSYQSVKHICADLISDLEQAEATVRYAAWTADHSPEDFELSALAAYAHVVPRYFNAATQSILVHGGIGFTWEHDAHLYYKRAKTSEMYLSGIGSERLSAKIQENIMHGNDQEQAS
jgi:alkylation response protein AidB-like acyl-CoA dehydrogenase